MLRHRGWTNEEQSPWSVFTMVYHDTQDLPRAGRQARTFCMILVHMTAWAWGSVTAYEVKVGVRAYGTILLAACAMELSDASWL